MQRPNFPFHRAPDAFFMALPGESKSLQINNFETPWGPSDDRLCYWNGVLFGEYVQGDGGSFAKLLPTLDRQRDCPWPSADAFKATIFGIVDQFHSLEVWCERDCDQHPMKSVDSLAELQMYMELALSFCESGRGECPSFSYRPQRANNIINWTR